MLPGRDELLDSSARRSLRSLLGIAITANGNLCAADCVVALAVTSVDSMDCEKPPKYKGNSGLSPSIHLGFTASWHSACYSKQRLVVPTTEAWALGPQSGGWPMTEFAARFRTRHDKQEERQWCACRSEYFSRLRGATFLAKRWVRDGRQIPLPTFRSIFEERRPA